jgi:hypothetical protein
MQKCLYFLAPRFGKWKLEQKIINKLKAPCYRVVDKRHKQFANDNMWIVWNKDIITVYTTSDFEKDVNSVFYRS